jgi:aspartate kinase
MIIQSVAQNGLNEIAFTVAKDSLRNAEAVSKEMLADLKAKEVVVDQDIAKVSVVGAGMLNKPGIASNMFKALADAGVNIQMISTSEIKISCMVSMKDAHKAVKAIHKAFELEKSNEPIIV